MIVQPNRGDVAVHLKRMSLLDCPLSRAMTAELFELQTSFVIVRA
jgi:hypothetical protein